MNRLIKSLSAAVFALSFILGFPVLDAYALKCVEPPRPLVEELEYSKLAFKGTLIAESNDSLTFQVTTWWKGASTKSTVTLHQNFWTEFEQGEEYLVFAGDRDGKLRPNLCGNTGPIQNVDTEPLGPGTNAAVPLEINNSRFEAAVLGSIIITVMSAIGVIRRFI